MKKYCLFAYSDTPLDCKSVEECKFHLAYAEGDTMSQIWKAFGETGEAFRQRRTQEVGSGSHQVSVIKKFSDGFVIGKHNSFMHPATLGKILPNFQEFLNQDITGESRDIMVKNMQDECVVIEQM